MNQEELRDLFLEQIREMYDAEQQLVAALPKLADTAEEPELAEAIRTHLEETRIHVARLQEVFGTLGEKADGKSCAGMKALIAEGNAATQGQEGAPADLAIIAGAQRVEHYEIASYGTVRAMAARLGLEEIADILEQTEEDEKEADAKLTEVADAIYNSLGSVEEEEEIEEEEDLPEIKGS